MLTDGWTDRGQRAAVAPQWDSTTTGWHRDAHWLGCTRPRQHIHPAAGMVHSQPCSVTSRKALPMPECPPCSTCNPWLSQVKARMPAGAGGQVAVQRDFGFLQRWQGGEAASPPAAAHSSPSRSQGEHREAVPTHLRAQQRFPGSASPSSQPLLGTQPHSRTISLQIFQIAR